MRVGDKVASFADSVHAAGLLQVTSDERRPEAGVVRLSSRASPNPCPTGVNAGPRMNSCARHSGRASSSMAKTKL